MITGDIIEDYEMATWDEFLDYYGDLEEICEQGRFGFMEMKE